MHKKVIAIIGDSKASPETYELAYKVGRILIDHGYCIQCGGLGGVMKGACEGAKSSPQYSFGYTTAIIPSYDRAQANEYADIIIPTGIDLMRNGMVINSDAVVAIGGGAGTLSEIALAWTTFKLILAFDNVDGWSKNLAHKRIDNRNRYPAIPEDCVYGVSSPEQMIDYLEQYLLRYNRQYKGVVWND